MNICVCLQEKAEEVQIKFIPRALQDSILDRYWGAYRNDMTLKKQLLELLKIEEKSIPGQIRDLENKLNNKKMNQTELNTNLTRLNERRMQVPVEIESLKKQLPPEDLAKIYYVENKINQDTHLFSWVLEHKATDDENVKLVCMYLEKWYKKKPEDYRKTHTLDQYKAKYSRAMAEIRQEMNEVSAHVILGIPIEEGFEFKMIPIFGRPELDEFTTILINAVGLRSLPSTMAKKYSRSSDSIIGAAVTQKSLFRTYTSKIYK